MLYAGAYTLLALYRSIYTSIMFFLSSGSVSHAHLRRSRRSQTGADDRNADPQKNPLKHTSESAFKDYSLHEFFLWTFFKYYRGPLFLG